MLTVKVVTKKNNFKKLKERLRQINNESFFYGYFSQQGKHSEWGLSYVALMAIHEFGTLESNGSIPPRPVFSLTMKSIESSKAKKNKFLKPALTQYFVNLDGKSKVDKALSMMAQNFVKETSGNFGKKGLLAANSPITVRQKGFDKPLIWTGELQSNLAYKTTVSNKLEVGFAT